MNKVLVTGADGFIGSHLTEKLVRKGYAVRAFSFYNSFNTWGWLDTLPKELPKTMELSGMTASLIYVFAEITTLFPIFTSPRTLLSE